MGSSKTDPFVGTPVVAHLTVEASTEVLELLWEHDDRAHEVGLRGEALQEVSKDRTILRLCVRVAETDDQTSGPDYSRIPEVAWQSIHSLLQKLRCFFSLDKGGLHMATDVSDLAPAVLFLMAEPVVAYDRISDVLDDKDTGPEVRSVGIVWAKSHSRIQVIVELVEVGSIAMVPPDGTEGAGVYLVSRAWRLGHPVGILDRGSGVLRVDLHGVGVSLWGGVVSLHFNND